MKNGLFIISLLLSTLILFNSARVSFTYAYYELDPVGFIESLCENKDKPELSCNGQCHLMKVSKSQDKEQKTPESIIDFKELLLYPNPISEFNIKCIIDNKVETLAWYNDLYAYKDFDEFFHPPRT